MSDWQVGDLAVCVDDAPCRCCGATFFVSAGRVYRVVGLSGGTIPGFGYIRSLVLEGARSAPPKHPACLGINHARFRKIRADEHKSEAEDWQLLLDSMTRKVSA